MVRFQTVSWSAPWRVRVKMLKVHSLLVNMGSKHNLKDPMSALTVLREIGADMQMKTRNNQTALHLVASSCAPYELERATKFLIQNDVDPGHLDDDGKTMMHYINERNDITNQQKDLINNLFNPYHSVSFSPRLPSSKSKNIDRLNLAKSSFFNFLARIVILG